MHREIPSKAGPAVPEKAGSARACFVAFDLLNLHGEDLRQRPLERRGALSRHVRGVDGILFSEAMAPKGRSRSPRLANRASGVEARRQPISERDEPHLAEVDDPGVCAGMSPMPRDGAYVLSDLREQMLSIVCEPCGRRGAYSVERLTERHGYAKLTDLPQMLVNCPRALGRRP